MPMRITRASDNKVWGGDITTWEANPGNTGPPFATPVNTPVLGFFMRNCGAYRVDRRIRHELYKDVLKTYSQVILERGYHSMFFPGGTRSPCGANGLPDFGVRRLAAAFGQAAQPRFEEFDLLPRRIVEVFAIGCCGGLLGQPDQFAAQETIVHQPGVAFDLQGRRLGRGKGFYDRLLADLRGTICGVAFDEQIVSELPVGPTDISVNCILTPTRFIEL